MIPYNKRQDAQIVKIKDYINGKGKYVTGEGTSITLENTINTPFNNIILKGNTKQQQYSGKNLLPLIKGDYNDFNNNVNWKIHNEIIVYNRTNEDLQGGAINLVTGALSQWANNGKDLQLKPNTTYTLSLVANGNYTKKENTTAFIMLYLNQGKELLIYDKNSNNKYTTTFTTDDKGYFGICLYGQYITCTNFMIYNIQLEEGSTATDYEPYVGGTASPNPDYPQEIHCVKGNNVVTISNGNVLPNNLSDATMNGITYTINGDKSINLSGTATSRVEPKLYNGAGYTIPAGVYKNTTAYRIIGYTGTKYIIFNENVSINLTKDVTFKQLYFRIESGATVNETIYPQIILSSKTDTSYVPHEKTDYKLNLGNIELNAIDNYKDYFKKENGKWYKVENIGSYTFEGNENFSFTDVETINQRFDIKTSALNIACLHDQQYKLFTHFRNKPNNDGIWGEYYMSRDWVVIKDNDNIMTSLEDFKAWLSANKPTIYYARISPIDIEITDTTLINQLNEISQAVSYDDTTNISQINANLPFIINAEAVKKLL